MRRWHVRGPGARGHTQPWGAHPDDIVAAARAKPAGRRGVAAAFTAAVMVAVGLVVPIADAPPAGAVALPATFDVPGTYAYTVPAGTDQLTVDALGGAGGGYDVGQKGTGGPGGRVESVVAVAPGDVVTVIVGGAGGNSWWPYGGYGGGAGNGDGGYGNSYGGGGGGASTVKVAGTRLVVAGGGGGGARLSSLDYRCGGHGGGAGGPNGGDGCSGIGYTNGGKGGTTTGGGAAGTGCGSSWPVSATGPDGGDGYAGGGGGYYGGGGACSSYFYGGDGGGGGGSSYATPDAVGVPLYSVGSSPATDGEGRVTLTPGTRADLVRVIPGVGTQSRDCFVGGQQVVENTTAGVHTFVYTRVVSSDEVHVCWRAESGTTGYGGKLVVTAAAPDPGGVGTPSADADANACTTTTPNAVPGSHPTTSGGVGGVPYSFDAYSDGASTVWACVKVGTAVTTRVIVPVSVVGPTVGALVTWYPDEGTP